MPPTPASTFTETEEETSGYIPVPTWTAFPWLRAGFSLRHTAEREKVREQNLGFTPGSEPGIVQEQRRHFLATVLQGDAMPLATVQQVHGAVVHQVVADDLTRSRVNSDSPTHNLAVADGLLARDPEVLLGIVTADCVPVLVADIRLRAVAAFHAGWRGTVQGIVRQGAHMLQEQGSSASDLIAAIGPAIRPCCFEVGTEVLESFGERWPYAHDLFTMTEAGSLRLDLQEANRRQLLEAGLAAEQIQCIPECTSCSRERDGTRRYFSYRAEDGQTGRMLSVIGATAE